jgi:hypothetical protein
MPNWPDVGDDWLGVLLDVMVLVEVVVLAVMFCVFGICIVEGAGLPFDVLEVK